MKPKLEIQTALLNDLKLSNILQVKTLQQNNRTLYAKQQIKQFDTIMELQPLAISVLAEFKAKMCNYCLQQKQLVRCGQCKGFYYCSGQCQKADWIYHKLECKFYAKMIQQKNISPLKQMHTQFCLNMRVFLIAKTNESFRNKIMSMVSLQQYQYPQKLKYFQQMSVVLMQNLALQKNEQNMMALMSIANRISINTFTIQDPLYNYGGIAIGLYNPANLINHDCQPNCIQIFDGRYLKIMANKNIQIGQQITISYTNSLDSINQRKQTLRNNYFFECFCQLCHVQNMLDMNVFYLLCPKCKAENSLRKQNIQLQKQQKQQNQFSKEKQKEDQNKSSLHQKNSLIYICLKCQQKISQQDIQKIKKQIQQHKNILLKAIDYPTSKKQFFTLKKILHFNDPLFGKLIRQVYYKAIVTAISIQDPIQQKKMFEQCYILLKEEFNKMKTWYKMDEGQQLNLLFIWKYAQMGKLCYNLGKAQKAFQFTQKALNLAKKINYKHKFKDLKQLQKRMDQMKIQMSMAKGKAFGK